MPDFAVYLLIAAAAYLLGSIPTGFLVARAKGIDIRTVGSGNMGATNVFRSVGRTLGIVVLLVDALKGWLACLLGKKIWWYFAVHFPAGDALDQLHQMFVRGGNSAIIAGIFAVLGHNFTCWLKFKGGKGIATSAGVYLALAPWAVLIGAAVFFLAVLVTRYVSVGSISAAVALPAAVWVLPPHNVLLGIVTTVLGVLAIYRHKGNIRRLAAGTESRLQFKKETT
jgi:glycerol-3-phosphate acyltransferase PlsY